MQCKMGYEYHTFRRASIFCGSLRRRRIQRRRRLMWYIFSEGTQDFGRRSGGMVRPYSQPDGRGIYKWIFSMLNLGLWRFSFLRSACGLIPSILIQRITVYQIRKDWYVLLCCVRHRITSNSCGKISQDQESWKGQADVDVYIETTTVSIH